MRRANGLDERQQGVHRRLVGADDDPAAAHLLQLADRRLGLGGEPQQPRGVVLQQPPASVSVAVARRPIEQPVAQLVLEPADRLADGRLRPVELLGGLREAALGGDRDESSSNPAAAFERS